MRPAAMRSSVDLPDPERPSRPRISPSRRATSISASTGSGSPDGFAKAMADPSEVDDRLVSADAFVHALLNRAASDVRQR